MARICVAGGTGEAGREVVRQALDQGHAVAVLSRNPPLPGAREYYDGAAYFRADVTTGKGVPEALAGADVVVDCLEARTGKALRHYAAGGAVLLGEAAAAGVARAVQLSIVNCDQSTLAYYRSKADKERVYERSALDTRTVRATHSTACWRGVSARGPALASCRRSKGPGSRRSRRRMWRRPCWKPHGERGPAVPTRCRQSEGRKSWAWDRWPAPGSG
ncbi:SDR family oxidoreductase [Arthrobacter sp. NPDC056493]|uniref:SDR family oxidoreductase n=1 Tax=Arthrobacter sp. NPDC056493 TaxID=3345839 RepID=UPI0036733C92